MPPTNPNPFPGLRPFRSEEHHLFFGREEQTAALLQLLRTNRFLAVVGTSGSGKSSLVRAGMIAELHGGTMTRAGSTWEVVVLRPGGSPIENLARAIVEADLYDAADPDTLPRLLATLRRSRFGLVEAVKQCDVFGPGTNLLVVVDQFEELFRFRQQGIDSEEAAAAFVNLLLTAGQQAECPIFVTITMRSDYLGDCSEIPGLAEAVNDGEYLIPRLLRDQKRDAIEKPIGVGGAQIAPLLVQRLLNDVGDDPDQLPVLQHALMRIWEVWSAGDSGRPIDFCDFEAIGGLDAALSNHADEIYQSLPDEEHRRACERIFKTLTEKGADNRGIRRPTRLARLAAIAGAERATVVEALGAFRQPGVTFLMPGMDHELDDQTVLDLSHESLMRGWRRLRGWVEEEAQSARIFRRLADTAWLWREGKASLFRDPDLQIALSWRDEEQPNGQWAEQYGGQFDAAIAFLQASELAAKAEIEAREAARQRELEQTRQLADERQQRLEHEQRATRKLRAMLAGLAAVAVIAAVACVAALLANNKANTLAALAQDAADKAEQNAAQAEHNAHEAQRAQQATAAALADVEREKSHAEQNLQKAVAAEKEAQQAEQRSREFRYATDVQLAATLLADESANATQVHARLADHDPAENHELAGKEDLRGFEWHYLNRVVQGRATVIQGFDKDVVAAVLSPEGELVTLDGDARLQRWNTSTRQPAGPALDLKKGRGVTDQALARDGRRAALATGNQVHLVDALSGEDVARTIPAQTRAGLVFSPDGRMLITVDSGIGWWDAASARPIARQEFQLIAQGRSYQPISVSADGLTVAVGGQGDYRSRFSVFRMNPETREINRLVDKAGSADSTKRALAISPDGGTVAVSLFFQGAIALYDAATGKLSALHDSAHTAPISALAFSPDGTQLVTAAMDGSVKVWEDYKRLKTALVGHAKQIDAVAFLAGGKQVLTAGKDKTVRLWNVEQNTASLQRTLAGARGARAVFSPDGTLLAVSGESKHLALRDGATGEVVAQLPERSDELGSDSVAFSPDGRLLAAGFGGKKDVSYVELWDIDRRQRLAVLPGSTEIPGFTTSEYSGTVPALAFSPDGKQLVAGFGSLSMLGWGDRGDHPLVVYDVAARRVIRRLEGHRNDCVSVVFSRDGSRMASASYDLTARIWDTDTWTQLHVLDNPDAASDRGYRRVCDVAFSPDGRLLAMASAEGNVIVWDAARGEQLETLSGHANEVWSVAFSPDGRTLASGSTDGTIRLWNTATWRELVRLEPQAGFDAKSLAFSPDGNRLLAASYRGEAMIWSVQPAGGESGPTPEQLASWLKCGVGFFQNRIRWQSEHLRLHEALEKLSEQRADNEAVQSALAAARANRYASRQEWKQSTQQFDHLKQLSGTWDGLPRPSNAEGGLGRPPHAPPDGWLRAPGLLRLATALFHQDRPAEAATLLTGGEKRRAGDGNGTRASGFGFGYNPREYPFKVIQVYRGSPAWRAGLRAGDLLLKFNDVEVSVENLTTLAELSQQGTTVRFTVQHPGQEEPKTVELTKASHIQDDVTDLLIEELLAAVDQKLGESAEDPGLLELRAGLAGQSSDYERQVADYTVAIESLAGSGIRENSGQPVAEFAKIPEQDLARLYRRRGNAYLGLKRWQEAVDDFAKGVTDETSDEAVLENQALAQAEILTPEAEAFVRLGRQEESHGIHLVDYPADGATEPATINGEDCRFIETAQRGFGHAYFTIDDDFKPALSKDAEIEVEYWDEGSGRFEIHYDADDNAYKKSEKPVERGDSRQWKTARFGLENVRFANRQNGKADFRIFAIGAPLHFKRIVVKRLFPGSDSDNPWVRLVAAHLARDDQAAIDEILKGRPQIAGPVGDLFTQGEKLDWRRAVEIYSKGVAPHAPVGQAAKPDLPEVDLLSRRARAYEALKDWNAAAADWRRAAAEDLEGAKLLADFGNRLAKADGRQRAEAIRQRARKLLEAILQTDPGDDPAIGALADLLLDMSDPDQLQWSLLQPAELKTAADATLALNDDGSLLVRRTPDIVTLPDAAKSVSAVRVETSPDASAPGDGAAAFKEYQVLSTRLPNGGFFGQFVRIDLPGDNKQFSRERSDGERKMLNLAELQVFKGERNIAAGKKARQSSTRGDAAAPRAVDGNTDSSDAANSFAHTDPESDGNPWWEVDLESEQAVDRMVIWNRIAWPNRMNHFRVRLLDASRNVVFEQFIAEAPNPSREISRHVQLMRLEPDAADGSGLWQLTLDTARRPRPWKRFRVSATDEQAVLAGDAVEAGEVKWTVVAPSQLIPAAGTALTAQADGSVFVEPVAIALPEIPDAVKLVRVETSVASKADQSQSPVFKDFCVQALGAPISESGTFRGRYVRIDLPGDNKQFSRERSDGERKMLNLAELQVFKGERNIAAGKKARQSSTRGDAAAPRAVDGNTDSSDAANSFAHTDPESDGNPWWEMDLESEQAIDRMVIWNRVAWPNRMNHFRVRLLDASRNVVFERVIDKAPNPSKEISCQSLLAAGRPADADKPRRSLRLSDATGASFHAPFRISTAAELYSLEREEAGAEARKISAPAPRLAAAYDVSGEPVPSADWFARALDGAKRDYQRMPILKELANYPAALAELAKRRPDDDALQLALARRHVAEGREKLSREQSAEALADFQEASDIFTRLLDENPEPEWTVIKPTEITSEGGATLTLQPDGSILASGKNPEDDDSYTLVAAAPSEPIVAVRLEALPDASLPRGGSGRDVNGDFSLRELSVALAASDKPSAELRSLRLADAVDSYHRIESASEYPAGFAIGGHPSGWDIWPEVRRRQTAIFKTEAGAEKSGEKFLVVRLKSGWAWGSRTSETLGRFRLSVATQANAFDRGRLRLRLPERELAALDVAVGKAHARQGQTQQSAAAFARALDRVEDDEERKTLIEEFKDEKAALAAVASERRQDLPLQLGLARSLAESGKKALADGRQDEALPLLAQAQETFARLVAEHPEPKWTVLRPTELTSEGGAQLTLQDDGSILVSGKNPDQDSYTLTVGELPAPVTAIRLETLSDPTLPNAGPGRAENGTFVLTGISVVDAEKSPPPWAAALADYTQAGFDVSYAIAPTSSRSNVAGWAIGGAPMKTPVALFAFQEPWKRQPGSAAAVRLEFHWPQIPGRNLGRFRLSTTDASAVEAARLQQELKASGLAELSISLGNAHARQGRTDAAATAFGQAFDLAADRDGRVKVLNEASAYEGVLEKLPELRPADAALHDALARHFQDRGDFAKSRAAAETARALYEQQLQAEPADTRLAKDLADLLLDVSPVEWTLLRPTEMESQAGATLTLQPDASILAGGANADQDVYTLTANTAPQQITAIRLEALPDPSLPSNGPGRCPSNGNFHLYELRVLSGAVPAPLTDIFVEYDEWRVPKAAQKAIDGNVESGAWGNGRPGVKNAAVITTKLQRSANDLLKIELHFRRQHNLGRFRLSATGNASAFPWVQGRFVALKMADPWLRLAAAYRALGESDQARQAFVRAVELAAGDGAKAAVAREAAACDDVFAQLLERFPSDKALRLGQVKHLASKHIQENQFQAAVELLCGALLDFPDDVELRNERAGAQMKLGHWHAADQDYAHVIELESDEGRRREAERTRAEIQLRLGQFDEGAERFLEHMFLSPNDFWRIRDAGAAQLLAVNAGATALAARFLQEKAPANMGADPAGWLVRILVAQPGLITNQNTQKLLDAAKKADAAWTERMTAAVHYRLGDLKLAEPLVTNSAGDRQFQALAAMLLYDQGKIDEARKALNGVTNWLSDQRAGDLGSAIPSQQEWRLWAVTTAVWREAARKLIGPRKAELDASLNKLEIVQAEYGAGAAQKDVTEVLRKRLADVQLITLPRSSYLILPLPDYDAAFGDPVPKTLKLLKVRYVLNGRAGQAAFGEHSPVTFPVPNALREDEPGHAAALLERAGLLADAELYDEALADLDRLAALKIDSPEADALRGRVLGGLNRPDEALQHLNRAVEAGSQDALVYAARGTILLKQGQTIPACADLEKSLKLEPTGLAARSLADLLLAAAEGSNAWTILEPVEMKSEGGASLTLEADGSVLAGGTNPDRDVYTITAKSDLDQISAIRLEALPDRSLPSRGPGRDPGNGNFHLNELRVYSAGVPANLTSIAVAYDEAQEFRSVIDGKLDSLRGWSNWPRNDKNTAVIATRLERASGDELKFEMYFSRSEWPQHNLGRFRLSVSDNPHAFERSSVRFALAKKELDPWLALAGAYALNGEIEQAAKHFAAALDAAGSTESRRQVAELASRFDEVLAVLSAERPDEPFWQSTLARHFADQGEQPRARQAAARARALYEQKLAPDASSQLAQDLAELLETSSLQWTVLRPTLMKSQGGATLSVLDDGSILAGGSAVEGEVYTITATAGLSKIEAFRLEALPHESLPQGSSGRRQDGDFALTEFKVERSADGAQGSFARVVLQRAVCDYAQQHSPVMNVLDGKDDTFWDILPHIHQRHVAVFEPETPLELPPGGSLRFTLEFRLPGGGALGLGRFRLSVSDDSDALAAEESRLAALKVADPWQRLALAYHRLGDRAALDRLLAHHPAAAAALGDLYATTGDSERALAEYNRAITAGTKDARLFAARAEAHEKLGHWELAIADWGQADLLSPDKKARLGKPDFPPVQRRAWTYGRLAQYDKQVEDFTELLKPERFPNNPWFLADRGDAYARLRQSDKAAADFDRAIEVCAPDGRGYFQFRRAIGLAAQGEWKQAAEGARSAFQTREPFTGDWWNLRDAALIYAAAGDTESCRRALVECFGRRSPGHPNPDENRWIVETMCLLPDVITGENRSQLLEMAEKTDAYWRPRLAAAIHLRSGDDQSAAGLLDENAAGPEASFLAAMVQQKLGHHDRAKQLLAGGNSWLKEQRAKESGAAVPQPHNWRDWAAILTLWREATRKLIDPRISQLDGLLTQEPENLAGLVERAGLLADVGLYDEAIRDLDRLAALDECAALYERLGQGKPAAVYGKLIDQRRHNAASADQLAEAFRLRGAHYVRAGEWKLAAADYAESVTVDRNSNSVDWMVPAALWAYAGDEEQHRRYCRKMAARFGKSKDTPDVERTLKVSALVRQNPPIDQTAAAKFQSAMAANALDPGLGKWFYATQALLSCRSGDLDAAQRAVDESLRLLKQDGDAADSAAAICTQSVQSLVCALDGDAARARTLLGELKTHLATGGKLAWREDGTIDGRRLLSGDRVQHDLLIAEILRRQASALIDAASADGPNR